MIYDNIIELCAEKNVSIARLEKECGLGNGTIRLWEQSSPRVSSLIHVAKFFGVTLDELTKEA